MMATSFIPFNTAKNPYLLDNVTVVNSPLLGCWKNISEWKQCQWVKKKNKTFLLRQRLKNIETLIIKEDSKKRSYILAHTHTRTQHTQCSESVHLSSHHLPSLLKLQASFYAASPAKHVLHRLGNKAVILPGCLFVCYHLNTDTHAFIVEEKQEVNSFKVDQTKPLGNSSPGSHCLSSCRWRWVVWLQSEGW